MRSVKICQVHASSEYNPKIANIFSDDADFVLSINPTSITLIRILNNRKTHNLRFTKTSLQHNTIYLEQHSSTKQCSLVFENFEHLVSFIALNCCIFANFYIESSSHKHLYYVTGNALNATEIKKHLKSILTL
jgi:hypothetical protein